MSLVILLPISVAVWAITLLGLVIFGYSLNVVLFKVNITYFYLFIYSVQTHHPRESSSSWAQRMMTLNMSLMTSLLSWMSSLLEMAGPPNGERLPGQEAINESDVKPDIINVYVTVNTKQC